MIQGLSARRKGSLLLELVVASVLLGVVMSAAVPALGWIARQRSVAQQRQAVLLEVDNLMERMTALDWSDLTPQRAAEFKLSDHLLDQLSEPKLDVAVQLDGQDETAKEIRIEMLWSMGAGRPAPPVRLSAWFFRQGEK
jgi:Tfp pilus assembly protein PilE